MTDEIAELRALLEKATPRPWAVRPDVDRIGRKRGWLCLWNGARPVVYPATVETHDGESGEITTWSGVQISPDDAALIVAAVNALPALLTRVEAAESALAASRAECERLRGLIVAYVTAETKRPYYPNEGQKAWSDLRALAEKGDGK
jgi:hypothetical protein